MRKIEKDGLLLCELQATAFEKSREQLECSSPIFIRRFMKSKIAKRMDNESILESNLQANDLLALLEEEYGKTDYGKIKYTANELYWIGYTYRYFAYTYEISSAQAYFMIKPQRLRDLFVPYHTMDTAQAIERILEADGIFQDDETELQRQYEIFKSIRKSI